MGKVGNGHALDWLVLRADMRITLFEFVFDSCFLCLFYYDYIAVQVDIVLHNPDDNLFSSLIHFITVQYHCYTS